MSTHFIICNCYTARKDVNLIYLLFQTYMQYQIQHSLFFSPKQTKLCYMEPVNYLSLLRALTVFQFFS